MVMFAGKLKEFNNSLEGDKKVDDGRLARLEGIMKQTQPSDDDLNTLKAVLEWPPSKFTKCYIQLIVDVYQTDTQK